ncbi:MAG: hypothetical protein IH571_03890 [Acholeplasmataceae bacterium]|nr:hypothetical protein [Acholeplasmataceae bacterium]
MNILNIAIILFIVLESLNIMVLYFNPDTKYGNGVAVFKHWETTKNDKYAHLFIKYLINWIANAKLIFILLLIVLLVWGDNTIKMYSIIAMIVSIGMYYWRLHPLIDALDQAGYINPKGYSKKLILMIAAMQGLFVISLIVYFISK